MIRSEPVHEKTDTMLSNYNVGTMHHNGVTRSVATREASHSEFVHKPAPVSRLTF